MVALNWTDFGYAAASLASGAACWIAATKRERSKADNNSCPQNGGRMDERIKALERDAAIAAGERTTIITRASKHSNRLGILEKESSAHDSRLTVLYDRIADFAKQVTDSVEHCRTSIETKLDGMDDRIHDLDKRESITEAAVVELKKRDDR